MAADRLARHGGLALGHLRPESRRQAVVVTASALNVRATPSTSGALLGQTARGQVHFRLGQSGDWILIQFDQRQAWVHGDYTTTVSL